MSVLDVLDAANSPESVQQTETRPHPDSYDSGEECSVDHLRQLYRLLELEDNERAGCASSDSCLHAA